MADLNWPGLASVYMGYRNLRRAHEFTNTQLANYRRRHRIDNFYATRRPENNYLSIDNMPQGRKRTFIAAPRQSGYQPVARRAPKRRRQYGPIRYQPTIRRPMGGVRPQDLTYVNVFKMVEYLPSTTSGHESTIPGVVKPADILGCPKLSRYLNSYQWIKLHKMGVEWLGTHSTFIMSTYDTDTNELKEDEAFFERSINLRLHRNDKNGKSIISRTQRS